MSRPKWIILAVFIAGLCVWKLWPTNEDRVMRDFMYGGMRMESQLTIPLVRAGPAILPAVVEAIQDRDMPRRRYAIGFVGRMNYAPALPVLERILEDETENIYFRGDALEAIYHIDRQRAVELIPAYVNGEDYLGQSTRRITDNKPSKSRD